jgi:hypothetical protein
MIKNLKTLAALACFTVAAVANSPASTILQQVNVALTVFSQSTTNANKAGTVVTETVKTSALTTKNIIQALAPGASAKAKLVEYTDYGASTNFIGYTYSVHSVIYTNGTAAFTNTPDYAVTNGVTNGSFTFTISYTNTNTVGGITNPVVSVLVTNTATTNYTFATNYAGGTVISNTVTAPTGVSPSGVVLLDNGYEIDDGGTLTVLTNTSLFPIAPGVTNVGNSNTYAAFSITPVTAASSEIRGSEKAVAGTPLGDADSGTSYDVDTVTVNAPGVWTIRLEAFANGAISTLNIGGDTKKNPPSYIDYTNSTWSAVGYGFIGGTTSTFTTTNLTVVTTNSIVTGSTPVLLKGTISESLYKFTK